MNTRTDRRRVGHVVGLWRYPVKSMAGEELREVEVSWHGFLGDRRWALIRNDAPESGFPWLTLRQQAKLSRYVPTFVDPGRPDASRVEVETPSGRTLAITDPELGKELVPEGVRVIKQDRGIFDAFPVSLITTQTIEQLEKSVGCSLDVRRFRPNLLVESDRDEPFLEDDWVGRVLRLGDLRLRVDKRDGRCLVITLDPESNERRPEILRAVARERQGCLGVYGSTVAPGRVRVRDEVILEGPAQRD